MVKSSQLVLPTATTLHSSNLGKVTSSLVQPYNVNTIHDFWPPLDDRLTTDKHMVHMLFLKHLQNPRTCMVTAPFTNTKRSVSNS